VHLGHGYEPSAWPVNTVYKHVNDRPFTKAVVCALDFQIVITSTYAAVTNQIPFTNVIVHMYLLVSAFFKVNIDHVDVNHQLQRVFLSTDFMFRLIT
jgi:hypothetical protein